MTGFKPIFILIVLLLTGSCVSQFIPETVSDPELFVVDGLITDQPGKQTVKISRSIPLGNEADFDPVRGCEVSITDNLNNTYPLTETDPGVYKTSENFKGEAGRIYILNIEIVRYVPPRGMRVVDYVIKSSPLEMLPVPEIDSLYYEKVDLLVEDGFARPGEGCRVLVNTSDPEDKCRYFRWDYSETWKIETPNYPKTINKTCWITKNSEDINVKTVTGLNENRITGWPVNFILNESDRLSLRYRMEVNQYSLNEDEYYYWSDLEKITEESGGIYDRVPSSIFGNMYCSGHPDLPVLGYFSVSSRRSKVIYIDEYFKGLINPYIRCLEDTLFPHPEAPWPPPGIFDLEGEYYWFIEVDTVPPAQFIIPTDDKGCVDCTVRGTTVKPDFWQESWDKKNIFQDN